MYNQPNNWLQIEKKRLSLIKQNQYWFTFIFHIQAF